MQQLHRDIYIKLKDEKLPSKNEINEIDRFFFGPHEEISYYTILSYGLLNRANEKNIKRVKDLISIFIENEEDDLLRAVIMTTYIYWNSGDSISNELIYFLKNCCMETFSEASLSAASSLADSAFQNKNEEILKTLKDLTVTCIASDDEITASLFVESTLRAATGKVWIDKDIIKLFSNTYAIQSVNFGIDLTISLKN